MPEVKGHIGESAVAVVVVEVAGVVGEVRFEDVEPSVAVVIGDANTHAGLFMAVVVVGAAGHHGDIGECAVVIVVEENAGLRVHGDINVRPAVVVEIIGNGGDGVSRARLQNAGFLGNVGESSVAIVVVEDVGVAGKAARPAHNRNALPLARRRVARRSESCQDRA